VTITFVLVEKYVVLKNVSESL